MNSTNDNRSFRELTANPQREFADRALFRTVEGLLERGVPHYQIAKALFDMAMAVAPGEGTDNADNADWVYLIEYFADRANAQSQTLEGLLADVGQERKH